MKGLLHRLAARAAGTARLVRSDARLPFGGGALDWVDQPLAADGVSVRELPTSMIAAPPDALPQRTESEPTRGSVPRSTDVSIELPTGAPAVQSLPQTHPAASRPDATLGAAEPRAHRLPVDKPHDASQAAREPSVPGVPPTLASAVSTRAVSIQSENRNLAPAGAQLLDDSSRHRTAPPFVEPARLMPSARVHADATTPRITPQSSAQPLAQTSDDTAEVHIHIGRIEVTAVHEAPAPRAQPSKRQAPMSLDAYLAERSKP